MSYANRFDSGDILVVDKDFFAFKLKNRWIVPVEFSIRGNGNIFGDEKESLIREAKRTINYRNKQN